jgi:hypothetical protein
MFSFAVLSLRLSPGWFEPVGDFDFDFGGREMMMPLPQIRRVGHSMNAV